MTYIADIQWS